MKTLFLLLTLPSVLNALTFSALESTQTYTAAKLFNSSVTLRGALTQLGDQTSDSVNVQAASMSFVNSSSITVVGTLAIDSATFFLDSTNNRIGIGTVNPTQILHVFGGGPILYVESNNTSGPSIQLSTSPGLTGGNMNFSPSTRALSIGNGVSNNLSVDVSGNVGIGTTSPTELAEVVGGNIKQTFNSNAVRNIISSNTNSGTAAAAGIQFVTNATESSRVAFTGTNYTDTTAFGFNPGTATLVLHNAENNGGGHVFSSQIGGSYAARMVISKQGAVGIATSPVSGNNFVVSTRTLVVTSAGNVGIGTPSPGRKLEVSGSGNTDTAIRLVETGNPQTWEFSVGLPGISNTQELTIRDVTSGNNRLVINTSGNVGIGTNAPASLLHVGAGGGAFNVFSSSIVRVGQQANCDTITPGAVGELCAQNSGTCPIAISTSTATGGFACVTLTTP